MDCLLPWFVNIGFLKNNWRRVLVDIVNQYYLIMNPIRRVDLRGVWIFALQ